MRKQNKAGWKLIPKPNLAVERTSAPSIVALDEAIAWIRQHRPIIWVGSALSVPEPTEMPSGRSLTESILRCLFPENTPLAPLRESGVAQLLSRTSLEVLFDEFDAVNYDVANSILHFFAAKDCDASPNPLHYAIATYYKSDFTDIPVCITTNWDSMLEKAFQRSGIRVTKHSGHDSPLNLDSSRVPSKEITVFHPHGSFEGQDVICSFMQESQQLDVTPQEFDHPTIFLGYSGYEPSLYRRLETAAPQLWCIYSQDDLKIPAKRRLLCRPNVRVYVGNMLDLLRGLGILEQQVQFHEQLLIPGGELDEERLHAVATAIFADWDLKSCLLMLCEAIIGLEFGGLNDSKHVLGNNAIRSLTKHIRNRLYHDAVVPTLAWAHKQFENMQTPVDLLAFRLRNMSPCMDRQNHLLLKRAEWLFLRSDSSNMSDDQKLIQRLKDARRRCYSAYLGMAAEGDNLSDFILSQIPALWMGDIALGAELSELAAFGSLHAGDQSAAQPWFDNAATQYYLAGLEHAGHLNEWAANNVEEMSRFAREHKPSLIIPHETDSLKVFSGPLGKPSGG
jgi:SIR2-like protein